RRLHQMEALAQGAIEIYKSPDVRDLPPETAALIAGQAKDSLKSLGTEGLLTPDLAPLYAEIQLPSDRNWHVPAGWIGDAPSKQYFIGVDKNFVHGGRQSLFIRSVARTVEGTATVFQQIAADSYRGKRVRLSAFLASASARGPV